MTAHEGSKPASTFRGVLLDWRGTLVVAPTDRWLVETALRRLGRCADSEVVEHVLGSLRGADRTRVDSSQIDTDVTAHRVAYAEWFRAAGLDGELSAALYAAESDVALNEFAHDVGPLLQELASAGVRIGILSDIHVDLRPVFAVHQLPDGRPWSDVVHTWTLSFEAGAAKPDPAIFRAALEGMGMPASDVLMVGDRGGWDGAAVDVGMTALVLPPLTDAADERLHRVLDLVLPGRLSAGHGRC
ncbi:HAD family hydrolase [Brachybacterium sp. YJGR34]|uniref:HAD family hydrolase n=1 Tax=Brachybacterium sp. YJGR34 TaxID=2059911 RepID=UPI000E0B4B73|nr:HAD family hydrolase [Brachybacterium sp. YJGR34]